jgi:hypothetical protein
MDPRITMTNLDAIPAPWDYNPSSWPQPVRVAGLAFVAVLSATYLALYQWRIVPDVWDPVFGHQSKQVLDSQVSEVCERGFGFPMAPSEPSPI